MVIHIDAFLVGRSTPLRNSQVRGEAMAAAPHLGFGQEKVAFFPGFSMDGSNQVVKFINVFFRF